MFRLRRSFSWIALLMFVTGATIVLSQQSETAKPTARLWEEYTQAMQQGLPKTAIEKLNPIIDRALQNEDFPTWIKASSLKIIRQSESEPEPQAFKVKELESLLQRAPASTAPILQCFLAVWYWDYYEENRWRFMQRTDTADVQSDDFTAWSVAQLLERIDELFQAAVADESLKSIATRDYNEIISQGTLSVAYRPTLYDVAAFKALEFYSSPDQALAKQQQPFELTLEQPLFSSREEFVAWSPDNGDTRSRNFRAIKLYQDLLKFHSSDARKAALFDADLQRLQFSESKIDGTNDVPGYEAALRKLAAEAKNDEIFSRVQNALAESLSSHGEMLAARDEARSGAAVFPGSIGATQCKNLILQLERAELALVTERVWADAQTKIDLRYRNLRRVYFRAIAFDYLTQLENPNIHNLHDDQLLRAALARPVAKAWDVEVPATEDLKGNNLEVAVPADLPKGFYYLFASNDRDFTVGNSIIQNRELWVSNLAIVSKVENTRALLRGTIYNATTGLPIPRAKVEAVRMSYNRATPQRNFETKLTDEQGNFEFSGDQQAIQIIASHDGDMLASLYERHLYRAGENDADILQTRFITDRAIYRPGQTIQFTGIAVKANQSSNSYASLANKEITVTLNDANGQPVETQTYRTNRYGSFTGTFTAPRDRLTGQMMLVASGAASGGSAIRVEEYKRPKFYVELDDFDAAVRLGDEVTLTGKSKAYTGANVNDAKVVWRVVRESRFPDWWYWRRWWMPVNNNPAEEIANGETITDSNGVFQVKFAAKPPANYEDDALFTFKLYADVTDTNGETRSAQSTVTLGKKLLEASISTNEWLTSDKSIELKIQTRSLNGSGQVAKGTVKVYTLKQPESVQRAPLREIVAIPFDYAWGNSAPRTPSNQDDPSNPDQWELDTVVAQSDFETDAAGNATVTMDLSSGLYRAVLETRDRDNNTIEAFKPLTVVELSAKQFTGKIPYRFQAEKGAVEPQDVFRAVVTSGYENLLTRVEVEHRGKIIKTMSSERDSSQLLIEIPVTEEMRGGFTVHVTSVKENRAYLTDYRVDVPWKNKELHIEWQKFTSKLEPNQQSKWIATIKGPDAERAAAEMVATLYDASLDAFVRHSWPSSLDVFYRDYSRLQQAFENQAQQFQTVREIPLAINYVELSYPRFSEEILVPIYGGQMYMRGAVMRFAERGRGGYGGGGGGGMGGSAYGGGGMGGGMGGYGMEAEAMMDAAAPMAAAPMEAKSLALVESENSASSGQDSASMPGDIDLSNISARVNLNETAFFFPQLTSGTDGSVSLEFTMPEALTEWRFLGLAHDTQLRAGLLEDKVVTSKDLMVQPNAPRFLRTGDAIEFTVKVTNLSATAQEGQVQLTMLDARTRDSVDAALQLNEPKKSFSLAAGESKTVAWRLSVPDNLDMLVYRAVGSSGRLSDGEEGYLPVLSNKIFVAEAMQLPIRGKTTKTVQFEKLLKSGNTSIDSKSLTVRMVSNPSWYAIMSLPYLMEYPHECNEQTFSRLYANALGVHILQSNPETRQVFEQWRNTPALDSQLVKNEDLAAVMLQESPWVRDAQDESQQRRELALLFDENRMNYEIARALEKLRQEQGEKGVWSWFPGGPANEYITLYITTGFGRLRHLGVNIDMQPAIQSLTAIDEWMTKWYNEIGAHEGNHLSHTVTLYLYGRSFFMDDMPVQPQHKVAFDYWVDQAQQYGLKLPSLQSQAQCAIALKRLSRMDSARGIMASLKERAIQNEELGMYWEHQQRWWWYHAPIETQAIMIEAFDEVMNDQQAVEDCKVWLLKQKQTNSWDSTKSTTDAVYALVLRGTDLLASKELVEVKLGEIAVEPKQVEAGTGFYEESWTKDEIKPEMGAVTLTKKDDGVAWGGIHWKYLINIDEVTPHVDNPLVVTKELFVKQNTPTGPQLKPVTGAVQVGDELVVKVIIKCDRNLEYVHLKDHRGSGTEPVNVLSHYKYQDGLAYYESTKDTATHFFIDSLPQGTYVMEYSTRVQLRGEYQTGLAHIECMYAPEFNSHSQSIKIVVE